MRIYNCNENNGRCPICGSNGGCSCSSGFDCCCGPRGATGRPVPLVRPARWGRADLWDRRASPARREPPVLRAPRALQVPPVFPVQPAPRVPRVRPAPQGLPDRRAVLQVLLLRSYMHNNRHNRHSKSYVHRSILIFCLNGSAAVDYRLICGKYRLFNLILGIKMLLRSDLTLSRIYCDKS